jgi:hypothetical protein
VLFGNSMNLRMRDRSSIDKVCLTGMRSPVLAPTTPLIDFAVTGQPIRSLIAEDWSAAGVRDRRGPKTAYTPIGGQGSVTGTSGDQGFGQAAGQQP